MERRLAAVLVSDMSDYSRLMGMDELGVLSRQKLHRRELIDPAITSHRGRIVKTTGDGLLAEFASAQDAVRCAMDIQHEMPLREAESDPDQRIRYRIGINMGDLIFDENDMFGDAVNVAARLEGLAEPGGLCISDIVHQTVQDRFDQPFRDMGRQRVKNITRPVRVWQWTPAARVEPEVVGTALQQEVQFCTSADGTHVAWAAIGKGPPVLRAPHWLNHLEYELQSPLFGPFLDRLAADHRLVRFDQRGNGLSDWDVERISIDAMIEDMEAVVAASGLKRFALLGISQGGAFAVKYAQKHPEQVACLILFGGYLRGRLRRNDPEEEKMYHAAQVMIRDGWGSNLPVFRNFFTATFVPDAPREIQSSFDEVQRVSINAGNAERIYEMNSSADTQAEAVALNVPTLVLHISGDQAVPIAEGRRAARTIPGARFVELPGGNHVVVEGQPCFRQFFEAVEPFIRQHMPE
ncbi:alpha/beta fold hydrolase [Seohaeicola zhoushanensis]|uniref:Guanylate cyclase domain-containing protein n=1 Tax=Seohaeicola zhoushanensis TaxID=1569283 RepID=A0A8J3M971_9RHOB|nr:alpha/beta fold hydrolase [Seohaeicola zhoushanensis]GHF65779.1 hypothetical protein GCM10017056_41170 [Seohaeicola zhoushanensis]